jgi:hypothetical protein
MGTDIDLRIINTVYLLEFSWKQLKSLKNEFIIWCVPKVVYAIERVILSLPWLAYMTMLARPNKIEANLEA